MAHDSRFSRQPLRHERATMNWNPQILKTTGLLVALLAALTVRTAVAAPPASLDPNFGNGGTVNVNIGGALGSGATSVALQADGGIVTAGTCDIPNSSQLCVARFTPLGALDATFGGTGKVLTHVGPAWNSAKSVLVQSDQKILVGGTCDTATQTGFCFVRYTPTGTLDTSFGGGTGSVVVVVSGNYSELNAMALQSDGKIVGAGVCVSPTDDDFCATRLTSTGALDLSFGGNGTGKAVLAAGPRNQTARAIAIQSDGKIVIAGGCDIAFVGGDIFCLLRLTPAGLIDATFHNGLLATIFGTREHRIKSLTLQPDGAIVAGGECYDGVTDQFNLCVARYTDSGQPDVSFGAGTGFVTTALFGYSGHGTSVLRQADGKIVLAGWCAQGSTELFCAARYLANGAPDATFAGGGYFLFSFAFTADRGQSAVLQPDGKLVLAGTCGQSSTPSNVCLARLIGGPNEFPQCSADIDGDGTVSSATDSVLLMRAALGFRGVALTQGVPFSSLATRNTHTLVRDYLFNHCGMRLSP